MTPAELRDLCLSFNAAVEDFPFNPETSVFKVLGKMFALTSLDGRPLTVNLKCDPDDAIRLRREHPGLVVPGWHMNKRHWNTVTVAGGPGGELPDRVRPGAASRTRTTWSVAGATARRYYGCVMYNDAAAMVLGMRPETTWNCIIDYFTDPLYRSRARNWERDARTVVAQFRATCAANPDDEGFQQVLADLKEASAEFAALWEERDIEDAGQIRKELDHPLVGLLSLESTALQVPARPDLGSCCTRRGRGGHGGEAGWLASPEAGAGGSRRRGAAGGCPAGLRMLTP
ncbi:hypothetical protein STENM36S_00208 [Streptomyces tendae]